MVHNCRRFADLLQLPCVLWIRNLSLKLTLFLLILTIQIKDFLLQEFSLALPASKTLSYLLSVTVLGLLLPTEPYYLKLTNVLYMREFSWAPIEIVFPK